MLEELKPKSEEEKTKEVMKRFNTKYIDTTDVFAPLGHIYSVYIEEAKIENPDFNKFVEELKEIDYRVKYSTHNNPYLSVINPETIHLYLHKKIQEKKIGINSAKKIMLEAIGGYDWKDFTYFGETDYITFLENKDK